MKRGSERILTTQPAMVAASAGDDHDHNRVRLLGSHAFDYRAPDAVRPYIGTRAEAQIATPLLFPRIPDLRFEKEASDRIQAGAGIQRAESAVGAPRLAVWIGAGRRTIP
jgi:hypothetical protein